LVGLPKVNTVLFAVGFDRQGGETIQRVYVEGLRAVLAALNFPLERFIYISSTGVHGQCDGSWVDESSACQPTRDGGEAHLQAEGLLAEHRIGAQAVVLRLAGIYGPGRVPRRRDLERGGPLPVADGFLNLIHVEDAVEVVLAAEKQAASPSTFLVADGHPVRRREYYLELARLLGLAKPEFSEPAAGTVADRRLGSKKVCTAKLMNELRFQLRYPTYRDGLRTILRG
jgi:nucleoside-diphosphate-sugar epimerase